MRQAQYTGTMKLGIISDTHDSLERAAAALERFSQEQVDLVVHCGDWKSLGTLVHFADKAAQLKLPVRGVLGNNDHDVSGMTAYARIAPGDLTLTEGILALEIGGVPIAAYHGHHKPTLRRLLADPSYRIILLGHTHKPRIERTDTALVVNPGSIAFAIPRSRDWRPSIALVDTAIVQAEIVFLGSSRDASRS